MKKLLLSSIALCSISATAFAQSEPTMEVSDNLKKLRFGVYVSPTLSWMRPSAAKDGDQTQKSGGSKLGITYGLMADYNFTENYTIATGLQVNSTGGKIETENTKASDLGVLKSNFNYTLQYLEIPVALKLKTDQINKFTFFGQLGVTLGFNISKKATYELVQHRLKGGDTTYKADAKEKITGGVGAIAPVVFQMNIGIGAQYAINKKLDAYVGLFFNNGFAPNVTDPTKFNGLPSFTDGNTRLNNFALRLGFYF